MTDTKMGRPPLDDPLAFVLQSRLTESERDLIRAAADAAGLTVSEWSRLKLVASAKRATRQA